LRKWYIRFGCTKEHLAVSASLCSSAKKNSQNEEKRLFERNACCLEPDVYSQKFQTNFPLSSLLFWNMEHCSQGLW